MSDLRRSLPDVPLPDALQALPLLAPPHDAWPRLRAKLPRTRRRPHAGWFALAAALALAMLLPRWLAPTTAPALHDGMPTAHSHGDYADPRDPDLEQLMLESAQLETLLALTGSAPVESAIAASLGDALRTRIGHIDALLARDELDPDARLPLWQERVLRLRELAGIENTQLLLAANGDAGQGVPVLAF